MIQDDISVVQDLGGPAVFVAKSLLERGECLGQIAPERVPIHESWIRRSFVRVPGNGHDVFVVETDEVPDRARLRTQLFGRRHVTGLKSPECYQRDAGG